MTSCINKNVRSKHIKPSNQQQFFNQDQEEMLKSFLNQLDFDHNELEGNELNEEMKFDQYQNIVEKQILNYITDNFNPKFEVKVNFNQTSKTLKQDNCKIKCEISCNCLDKVVKKEFDVKFKNAKTHNNLISLAEVEKELTTN